MEFQTLKKDKRKKWAIGIVVLIGLVCVIGYVGSRAKYQVTDSINIVNSKINYSPSDFQILAMYDDEGNVLTEMPNSGGFIIDTEQSYCTVNGVRDTEAKMFTNELKQHVFEKLKKNSKCYLYFKNEFNVAMDAKEKILAMNKINEGSPNFAATATTDEGLWQTQDDKGTSYYFRGNVKGNYVNFAGYYWRIIRINGDGSIRMIYDGTRAYENWEASSDRILSSTGSLQHHYIYFAEMGNFMECLNPSECYSSSIKEAVDQWFVSSFAHGGHGHGGMELSYISNDATFCNDASSTVEDGANIYRAYERIVNHSPSLTCSNGKIFSVYNSWLQYPVGLITADEVALAGATLNGQNANYYLYTGYSYLTMSAHSDYSLQGQKNSDFIVDGYGGLYGDESVYARPVINLIPGVSFTGLGTASKPYQVVY